jgi:hypothetical protein
MANIRLIYGYFMVNDGYIYIKYHKNVLYYIHHICTSDHFLHYTYTIYMMFFSIRKCKYMEVS